jgi:hypothetical protein
MRKATILLGILGIISLPAAAAQLTELPPGPNRDLVLRQCQACHDLGMIFDADGANAQEWGNIVEAMSSYGLKATPDDRAKILDYLTRYLGPDAKAGR